MKKSIREVHVCALEEERGQEILQVEWAVSSMMKQDKWLLRRAKEAGFLWGKGSMQQKRASFLFDFEVVSGSSHRQHDVLAWFVAWVFLTKWKQVTSYETLRELEFHFSSPQNLPLPAPPFLSTSSDQFTTLECYHLGFIFNLFPPSSEELS